MMKRYSNAVLLKNDIRFCEIAESARFSPFCPFNSLISFSQKGLHPPPRSPYAPKSSRFFAFRGSASLSPLLAKNRHSHYCSFESDFLHHEVGEIRLCYRTLDFTRFCDSQNLQSK
ncbi:hypothetical protein [Helicobacter sp. 23-1045]